jgi:hypothetical protein
MRAPFIALVGCSLLGTASVALLSPIKAVAEKPAAAKTAVVKGAVEKPAEKTAAACPYLYQNSNNDTASTKAVYDAKTKTLNIKVERSIPSMMWPIAESMTQKSVDKIFANCPTISLVNVNFQSGQTLTRKR